MQVAGTHNIRQLASSVLGAFGKQREDRHMWHFCTEQRSGERGGVVFGFPDCDFGDESQECSDDDEGDADASFVHDRKCRLVDRLNVHEVGQCVGFVYDYGSTETFTLQITKIDLVDPEEVPTRPVVAGAKKMPNVAVSENMISLDAAFPHLVRMFSKPGGGFSLGKGADPCWSKRWGGRWMLAMNNSGWTAMANEPFANLDEFFLVFDKGIKQWGENEDKLEAHVYPQDFPPQEYKKTFMSPFAIESADDPEYEYAFALALTDAAREIAEKGFSFSKCFPKLNKKLLGKGKHWVHYENGKIVLYKAQAKMMHKPVDFTWKGEGLYPNMHTAFVACEAALK